MARVDHGSTIVRDEKSKPTHRLRTISVPYDRMPIEMSVPNHGWAWSHDWVDEAGKHGTIGLRYSAYTHSEDLLEGDE